MKGRAKSLALTSGLPPWGGVYSRAIKTEIGRVAVITNEPPRGKTNNVVSEQV